MAESRNITFNVTFVCKQGIVPFTIDLDSETYDWGKSTGNLPSQIVPSVAGTLVSFGAAGRAWTMTGTEGTIVFYAAGYPDFKINFHWDIPYIGDNEGSITLQSDANGYYTISGDTKVPHTGESITMNTTITQVGP
jgi:hypothetical protein